MASTALPVYASPVVFSEDFSTTILPTNTQAHLGGNISLATFGEISVAANASIVNETLELSSTSGFRGIGIAFDADQLVAGTSYTLSVDIIDFELSSRFGSNFADSLDINVFTGNDFLADNNNSDRLFLNAQSGELQNRNGSATATEVVSESVISFQDSPNTGSIELNFDYDGSDSLAIFLGAVSDGFPHPTVTIDNITLSESEPGSGGSSSDIEVGTVPEPSSVLLLSLSSLALLRRKRND